MMYKGVEVLIVGNKLYATCSKCGKFIQLNKLFIGSLHFCEED